MTTGKTEIVIMGTIHGRHDQNPRYSADVLRKILLDLQPAAICVELDGYYFDPDGSLQRWVVEREELRAASPEIVVAESVCSTLGIEILPFDIEGKQEFFQQTGFWERARQTSEAIDRWHQQLSAEHPESEDLEHWRTLENVDAALEAISMTQGPEEINCDAYDRLAHVKGSSVWNTILSRYPDLWQEVGEYKQLSYDWWQKQNSAMAENLSRIADRFCGKRIAVAVGAAHRYILRDKLSTDDSVTLTEFWAAP